jgi:hypothetical protein
MNIIFGQIGSDAGYWYIGRDGKIHHVGGWAPEAMAELTRALTVLREASQLKAPGLAEQATKGVLEFVHGQLGHFGDTLKGGGVLVIG